MTRRETGYYRTAEINEESRGSVRVGNSLTHLVITSIQHVLKEYPLPRRYKPTVIRLHIDLISVRTLSTYLTTTAIG